MQITFHINSGSVNNSYWSGSAFGYATCGNAIWWIVFYFKHRANISMQLQGFANVKLWQYHLVDLLFICKHRANISMQLPAFAHVKLVQAMFILNHLDFSFLITLSLIFFYTTQKLQLIQNDFPQILNWIFIFNGEKNVGECSGPNLPKKKKK